MDLFENLSDNQIEAVKTIDYELDEKEIAEAIATLNVIDVKSKKFYGEFVLQKVYHDFLRRISIVDENNSSEIILYNLGKFSQVINDFETIYYTTIPDNKLSSFCNFLKYTADGYYPEGHIANTYDKLILDAEKRNKVLFEKLGI